MIDSRSLFHKQSLNHFNIKIEKGIIVAITKDIQAEDGLTVL
jgi:hypothetical protein